MRWQQVEGSVDGSGQGPEGVKDAISAKGGNVRDNRRVEEGEEN